MSMFSDTKRAFSSRNYDEDYYESDRDYEDDDQAEEMEDDKSFKGFIAKLFGKKDKYEDEAEEVEEERTYSSRRRQYYSSAESASGSNRTAGSSYSSASASPRAEELYEIVALSHFNFPSVAEIVREVKKGRVILFDISTLESTEDARRVVDYIGGAAEGMDCNFEKLFPSVFGISPKHIKITAKKSRLR